MSIVITALGCAAGLAVILLLTRKWLVSKFCAVCGAESQFGYSEHAEESPEKIRCLCFKCLVSQLEKDYTYFAGRAIVVQPAAGPPCYVFQPVTEWQKHFKESKIAGDAQSLLSEMEPTCHHCGFKANYLWIGSQGLTGDNFGATLDERLSKTLLQNNPKPQSLCGRCCVKRIAQDLEEKHLPYLEVCAPQGIGEGFVIPMGY